MKVEEVNIKIIHEGNTNNAKLLVTDYGENVAIRFTYKEYDISEKGEFPFSVLQEIRKKLELDKIYLLVNGSRFDVHPSGMQMETFNAYVMEIGKPATMVLDILDATDFVDKVGTVDQQEKFFYTWADSLGLWDEHMDN